MLANLHFTLFLAFVIVAIAYAIGAAGSKREQQWDVAIAPTFEGEDIVKESKSADKPDQEKEPDQEQGREGFKPGQVVILKSGSPAMVIQSIDEDDDCECRYWSGTSIECEWFASHVLITVQEAREAADRERQEVLRQEVLRQEAEAAEKFGIENREWEKN